MQNIENYGAKPIVGKNKYVSNREALAELHWLSIKSRIKFRILILVFKCPKLPQQPAGKMPRTDPQLEIQQHKGQTNCLRNSKTNIFI